MKKYLVKFSLLLGAVFLSTGCVASYTNTELLPSSSTNPTSSSGSSSSSSSSSVHVHEWDGGVITTEPTCEEDGIKTYTCLGCEETRTEAVPAKGHKWNDGVITTEATCDAKGVKTFTCQDCGKTKTEEIGSKGHTWDDGTVTKEATCDEPGSAIYKCTVCGLEEEREIGSLGHNYSYITIKEATCEEDGLEGFVCDRCGDHTPYSDDVIPHTGHDWGDPVVTDSTCAATGSKVYTCNNCGEVKTEVIAKRAHNLETEVTIDREPTCEMNGIKSYHCKDCGYKHDITIIPKLEHDFTETRYEATDSSYGRVDRVCKICGKEETEDYKPLTLSWSVQSSSSSFVYYVCSATISLSASGGYGPYEFKTSASNVGNATFGGLSSTWSSTKTTVSVDYSVSSTSKIPNLNIELRDAIGNTWSGTMELKDFNITSQNYARKGYQMTVNGKEYSRYCLSHAIYDEKGEDTWVDKYTCKTKFDQNQKVAFTYNGEALTNISLDPNENNLLNEDLTVKESVTDATMTLKIYEDGSYRVLLLDKDHPEVDTEKFTIEVNGVSYDVPRYEGDYHKVDNLSLKKGDIVVIKDNNVPIILYKPDEDVSRYETTSNGFETGAEGPISVDYDVDDATFYLRKSAAGEYLYHITGGHRLPKKDLGNLSSVDSLYSYRLVRGGNNLTPSNWMFYYNQNSYYSTGAFVSDTSYEEEYIYRTTLTKGTGFRLVASSASMPILDSRYVEDNLGTNKVAGWSKEGGSIFALEDVAIIVSLRLHQSGYPTISIKEVDADDPLPDPDPIYSVDDADIPVTPTPVEPDPVNPDPVTPDPVNPNPNPNPDPVTPTQFNVTFTVNYATEMGEAVYLVCPATGWSPKVAYRLSYTDGNNWTGTFTLPKGAFEYKYVIASYDNPTSVIRWEGGNNRSITVSSATSHNDTWQA